MGGNYSLYRTEENSKHSRAFAGLDFRKPDEIQPRLYSECSVVLKADISRFFYTIYTHSIPWAVLGKDKVKDWIANNRTRLRTHWSNQLDEALQSCQSRETFGLQVRPDTSRLIAEVLLAGIESDPIIASSIEGQPGYRLMDDYVLGFDGEGAAHEALEALRQVLWKYNLQLNDEKTIITSTRRLARDRWRIELNSLRISEADTSHQRQDIYDFLDMALHYCIEAGSDLPAIWASRRLSAVSSFPKNLDAILDAVLRLARDYPASLSHVAVFIVNELHQFDRVCLRPRLVSW